MASAPQRRRFERAIRDELTPLVAEGHTRFDRTFIEDLGQRFDVAPEEARDIFAGSKGDLWQGELIESGDDVLGWTAAEVTHIPSAGRSTDESGIH